MELFDLKALAGVITLITVLTNILKHFGVVKDGEKFANSFQFIASLVLTVIGWVAPDLLDKLPMFDSAAELLAQLGAYVIPVYLLIIKIGNLFHDVLAKIPLVNTVFGKQLTP